MENEARKRNFKTDMIICSPQLGISPDSNLGGEVHDREMLKALDKLGIELLIILPWGKKYPLFKHAKIYFLPVPFIYPPGLFNLLILPYLFFLSAKYHFDVLRIHSPNFVGPAAVFFKLFYPKVKLVATYHHLERESILEKKLRKYYDLITVVSQATKRELGERAVVIPNGLDPKYKPFPQKPDNKKILLYLGQLIPRKNVEFLLQIINKLPKNYQLLICGSGPLKDQLGQKAKGKNVAFRGYISEEEKVNYYNLASIFLYPSLKEGFGLSVLEAMACAKPVLVSDLPVFRELIHNRKDGFLEKLAVDRWLKIIRQLDDKSLAKKIGRAARLAAQKFSWENSASRLLESL